MVGMGAACSGLVSVQLAAAGGRNWMVSMWCSTAAASSGLWVAAGRVTRMVGAIVLLRYTNSALTCEYSVELIGMAMLSPGVS